MNIVFIHSKYKRLAFLLVSIFISCEDFVEIDTPRTEIVADNAFSTDETSTAVANGMYFLMLGTGSMYSADLEVFTGLFSDELVNFLNDSDYNEFANNELLPDNSRLFTNFWQNSYQIINNSNGLIEGLQNNTIVTPLLRNQLLGEALFIRAYTHFYMLNLFGPIPYSITSEVIKNNTAFREPVEEVYQKIITDLREAQRLMAEDVPSEIERTRPSLEAVTALLSRVYLYTENWSNAEVEASKLIENEKFMLEEDLNRVFQETSQEAIWQLVPENGETTRLGLNFPITFFGPGRFGEFGATSLSEVLLAAFESEDSRRNDWVGSNGGNSYPIKYKNSSSFSIGSTDVPEYTVMLRLAEQYLIRAEARTMLNDFLGAQDDLNIIRRRAGLADIAMLNREALLTAITQERRIELFAEGGHRWLDLKRSGQANQVLELLKDQWQVTDLLWPIPEIEIFNNSNLLPQNDGY